MNMIQTLDVKTPIVSSTIDVFDTMASIAVEPSDDIAKQSLDGARIVGTVNFAGEVMGSINIHVGDAFSRQLTAGMLGMEIEEIEDVEDIKDVISEVINNIGGNLKSCFNDSGLYCELSTPSITTGSDFTIKALSMESQELFAFVHKEHTFLLELGVKKGEKVDRSN